jgi:hypothetical protein
LRTLADLMVRRHAGKLAAIAIAVLVASLVWRARRRVGAVASSGVTHDVTPFPHHGAAPGVPSDEPVAANDTGDAGIVGVEPLAIEPLDPLDTARDPFDDAGGGPAAAARVFMAADAPRVEGDADAAEPTDATDAEPAAVAVEPEPEPEPMLDLARIERDLAGVEAALRRLDDGTYWTDEITGEPIDELVLAADPVARRNP